MGFRDPLTSAQSVDTNPGGGPGVRVYQDRSGLDPRGVVELRDGFTDHPPAELSVQTLPVLSGPAPGQWIARHRLQSKSHTSGTTTAPRLDLEVQYNTATFARRTAAVFSADVMLLPAQTFVGGRLALADTGWTVYGVGSGLVNGWGTGSTVRFRVLNSVCYVTYDLRAPNGITAGHGICTLPPEARSPLPVPNLLEVLHYGNALAVVQITSQGVMTINTAAAGSNGVLGTDSFPVG